MWHNLTAKLQRNMRMTQSCQLTARCASSEKLYSHHVMSSPSPYVVLHPALPASWPFF